MTLSRAAARRSVGRIVRPELSAARSGLAARSAAGPDSSTVLGRGRGAMGGLDAPVDGSSVRGVISLAGWALFDGRPADRVEAYIGDEPAVPLRRGEPRPDVASSLGPQFPEAIGSGFTAIVPVEDHWRGHTLDVVVRAYSDLGDVWTSAVARVRVEERAEPVGEMDELTVDRLWARHERPAGDPAGPLRICVFTHSLNLGGGELYLQELLLRLRRDYPVELLVVSPLDGPLKKPLRAAGIAVHITDHYLVNPSNYLGRVSELATIARAWAADVVLVNTLGVFAAVDAAVEIDVPVVWAIHESFELPLFSYLNWGEDGLHPEVERRWRTTLAAAHTVFEAETTLKMFAEQVPALQGRRIQYGIDVAEIAAYRREHDRDQMRVELGFGPEHTVLLCMGVFQERKSQLALVLAFARLADLFPDARLVLVGDHPSSYAAAVRDAVAGVGLGEQIRVIPIHPDTYRWYHVSDVLVSASDTESLPRSVLEAMAFGMPTMAADVFGLSEVIDDGVNGWLCRPRSGNALTVGLRRALECALEDRRRISEACEADSAAYDGKHYPAEYFHLMTRLVSTHRSRRGPE
jgi:D-inositol-3-phosphate glycosyltransferase